MLSSDLSVYSVSFLILAFTQTVHGTKSCTPFMACEALTQPHLWADGRVPYFFSGGMEFQLSRCIQASLRMILPLCELW